MILRGLALAAVMAALAGCSWPRAHANVRLTPDGATVTRTATVTVSVPAPTAVTRATPRPEVTMVPW